MNTISENDISRLQTLLQHTSEFITYFELADIKLIEWRQHIEQQSEKENLRIQQQLQHLEQEIKSLKEVLTQVGISRLRINMEQATKEGQAHLTTLHKTSADTLTKLKAQHQQLMGIHEDNLVALHQHTTDSLKRIDTHLSEYDFNHFRRVASESCMQVEISALDSIKKTARYLKLFQWRTIALVISATLFSSIIIGLYLSNELPWEIHKQVLNEREAGKTLMRAWPYLTQQEKNNILQPRE